MKSRNIWKNEEGSMSIIAAVAFTLVIALCGLVIDLGWVYIESATLQNAADAAVLSAARMLPIDVNDTYEIAHVHYHARDWIAKNGVDTSLITDIQLLDVVGSEYTEIEVTLDMDVEYFFGPIIGNDGVHVTKTARAGIQALTSFNNMVPLGIPDAEYKDALANDAVENIIIKYGGGDGDTGFFGAIDLDGVQGGGAKDFNSWLAFGYEGFLGIGDVLPVETGNMSGPTTDAFTTRYSQCTHFPTSGGCTVDHYVPECPRVIYIIAYTLIDKHTIRVEGFVPFVLEGTDGNGEIVASHIKVISNSGDTTDINPSNIDFGIFRVKLLE